MQYKYNEVTPLEIAEKFIDSYIERIPIGKFVPNRTCNYHQGVFLSGVEKVYLQNRKGEYRKYF